MTVQERKNSINYLALLLGVAIAIALSFVGVKNLIGDNVLGGAFQLSIAIVFAYFSYREIKLGSIEPKENTKE
jgi:hypothetical protein